MSRKHWIWIGALAGVLILLGVGAYSMRDDFAYARIATGYAAKQTCSCRHVSGRTLESCLADFPDDARGQITVSDVGDRVRASVLFGAVHSEAVFEEAYGCRIVD